MGTHEWRNNFFYSEVSLFDQYSRCKVSILRNSLSRQQIGLFFVRRIEVERATRGLTSQPPRTLEMNTLFDKAPSRNYIGIDLGLVNSTIPLAGLV
ncbi:hypothetical protein TNCT_84031 [Trichonephila clavata]|uniref:Uncharacterized protein n=1 Tax=Trichonephila clavata TaxID=2740835 RepID=A0A8X6LVC0_TRICU|nr:hypothetical protein TNCT_84031 [Trichonephila clavata]